MIAKEERRRKGKRKTGKKKYNFDSERREVKKKERKKKKYNFDKQRRKNGERKENGGIITIAKKKRTDK